MQFGHTAQAKAAELGSVGWQGAIELTGCFCDGALPKVQNEPMQVRCIDCSVRDRGLCFHTRRACHATDSGGHDKRADHDANWTHRDKRANHDANYVPRDRHTQPQPRAHLAPRCWP